MLGASTNVILRNSGTSDGSGSFRLMMILYVWLMFWSVVSWITVIHFSVVTLLYLHQLQCIKYSATRILRNTSRYNSIIPVLIKKLPWMLVEYRFQCLR